MGQHSENLNTKPSKNLDYDMGEIDLSELNHALVSDVLLQFNEQLIAQLNAKEIQEKELQALILNRAEEVDRLLNTLQHEDKRRFALLESKTNDCILTHLDTIKNRVKQDLGKVNKASKAIKKYRKA